MVKTRRLPPAEVEVDAYARFRRAFLIKYRTTHSRAFRPLSVLYFITYFQFGYEKLWLAFWDSLGQLRREGKAEQKEQ